MPRIILARLVLLTASLSRADVLIENFDSYNPPPGGSVDLVGQGGWVEADGLRVIGTGTTSIKVWQGFEVTVGFNSSQSTDAL